MNRFRAGVTGLVNPDELFHGHMGIFLCRRKALVPQQFLDRAKIGTGIEHVRRK